MYLTYWFITGANKTLMILDWAINLYSKKGGFVFGWELFFRWYVMILFALFIFKDSHRISAKFQHPWWESDMCVACRKPLSFVIPCFWHGQTMKPVGCRSQQPLLLCRCWNDRSSAGCGSSGCGSRRFYRSTRSDQLCLCVCVCVCVCVSEPIRNF